MDMSSLATRRVLPDVSPGVVPNPPSVIGNDLAEVSSLPVPLRAYTPSVIVLQMLPAADARQRLPCPTVDPSSSGVAPTFGVDFAGVEL